MLELSHDYRLLIEIIITLGDKMENFSDHPTKRESRTRFPLAEVVTCSCTLNHDKLTHPESWSIHACQAMACSYILSRDKRMHSKPYQCLNHSWIQDYAWKGKHQCCHPQENCSWHTPLKNALLELALNIDVKQLKNRKLVFENPFQRFSNGILVQCGNLE